MYFLDSAVSHSRGETHVELVQCLQSSVCENQQPCGQETFRPGCKRRRQQHCEFGESDQGKAVVFDVSGWT